MADVIISPNMALPIPVVGVDAGPDWANNVNACLTAVDSHDHVPGRGVPVTPAGLNISTDLTMQNNNLTNARTLRFSAQSSAPVAVTDVGCLVEIGVDLYYIDGAGNLIRVTQSGSVTGSSGTITGLPSGTASASFAAGTFVFQASTATPANIDGGSFIFRNNAANSKGLTLSPPNAMGADYGLFLPALPVSQKLLSLDASGNITTTIPSSVNLPGTPQSGGHDIISGSANTAAGLVITRGQINSLTSTIISGEGFTLTKITTGVMQINFAPAFADIPAVVASALDSPLVGRVVNFTSITTSSCVANLVRMTTIGTTEDALFSFIAIGQRT